MKLKYNNKTLDDYILFFLSDLDRKFQNNKKSISLVEKQIVQLLISYSLKSGDLKNDCLYFSLPFSRELAWIDLNWPIDLDPNVKNSLKRKVLDIEDNLKKPKGINWNEIVSKNLTVFTLNEVLKLKESSRISNKTWSAIENDLYLLYRKDKELNLSRSQYLFKMYGLLLHREELKETQEERLGNPSKVLKYRESLKIFSKKEKVNFRKKTLEHHYLQPGLVKLKGTSLEAVLNDSLISSCPHDVIFYEEESHRQGYDLEVMKPNFSRVRISSKTGSFSKKGIVHLSSNRTQGFLTLKDKTNSINSELDSISIITACVSVVEGNRKKYLRLALNPSKIKFNNDFKNWEAQNESKKNLARNWGKYSYDNGVWTAIITESKSHQVDFYLPLDLFDVVDEFYLD
jgi:hypothetical protein